VAHALSCVAWRRAAGLRRLLNAARTARPGCAAPFPRGAPKPRWEDGWRPNWATEHQRVSTSHDLLRNLIARRRIWVRERPTAASTLRPAQPVCLVVARRAIGPTNDEARTGNPIARRRIWIRERPTAASTLRPAQPVCLVVARRAIGPTNDEARTGNLIARHRIRRRGAVLSITLLDCFSTT
jgi:hypothetical protein